MKRQYIRGIKWLAASVGYGLVFSTLAHQDDHHQSAPRQQEKQEQKQMFECHISTPAKVKLGAAIPMAFKLTNVSDHSLNVLKWNTPFEGWFNDYLNITVDGKRVNYNGAMVKRFRPSEDDYSMIKPGQSKQATVNLAEGYDLSSKGVYSLSYSGRLHDVKVINGDKPAGKAPMLYPLQCNDLSFIVQ